MSSLRASAAGLEQIDRERRLRGWRKQSVIWSIEANVSIATLKRFWKQIGISYDLFISIVESVGIKDWKTVAELDFPEPERSMPHLILHEMPEPPQLCGRTEEMIQLFNLVMQTRLMFLWGMGGIGKTSLAAQLVENLANPDRPHPSAFKRIIWRSLHAGSSLDRFWCQLDLDLGITPQVHERDAIYDWADSSRILEKLQAERTLIVIDVVESSLIDRAANVSAWDPMDRDRCCQWFAQLALPKHNSCILVLTREKSDEVQQLEALNPAIRSLKLEGLKLGGIELLEQHNLKPETDAWRALINLYSGNPYALTMIATLINDQFGGSARELLSIGTFILGKMESVIAERIRHISDDEKAILIALASTQDPVSRAELRSQVPHLSGSTIVESMASLERKCLLEMMIEQEQVLFSLQPMVMKFVRKHWV
jgi:NB-ARC domain